MEQWRDIPGYDGKYQVSDLGRIRSVRAGGFVYRKTTTKPGPYPYQRVILSHHGQKKTFSVHRLVALVFVDNPHGYPEVNHIDFDVRNNRASNLEWVTAAMNSAHAKAAGRMKPQDGEHNGNGKITRSDAERIRELRAGGCLLREIAAEYGLHLSMVSRICLNKNWA